MPMSEADSLKQTILDRESRVEQARLDRQSQEKEAQQDRDTRKKELSKDRWLQAATSLISALVAIGVAFLAFKEAIAKVNAPSQHFTIMVAETKDAGHVTLKMDNDSGNSWSLLPDAGGSSIWKAIGSSDIPEKNSDDSGNSKPTTKQ
jgi:hypothetical protein